MARQTPVQPRLPTPGLVHEAMGEKEKFHKAWEIASFIDRGEQTGGAIRALSC